MVGRRVVLARREGGGGGGGERRQADLPVALLLHLLLLQLLLWREIQIGLEDEHLVVIFLLFFLLFILALVGVPFVLEVVLVLVGGLRRGEDLLRASWLIGHNTQLVDFTFS